MKIIYLAGGSGYIGTAITNLLLNNGYRVVNYDLNQSPHPMIRNHVNYEWHQLDLSIPIDMSIGKGSTKGDDPYGFIHLAAWKDLNASEDNPYEYYRNNLKSLLNSLELAHCLGCQRFIFSSSAAVYSDNATGATKETDSDSLNIYSIKNPYSITKSIGEILVRDVARQFGMRYICLRYCNPVGTDGLTIDLSTSMFGNIVKSLKENSKFTIYGKYWDTPDGTCIRDYIDIRDVARAHMYFLDYEYVEGWAVNIGTGKGVSCKEVCDYVSKRVPQFKYQYGDIRQGDAAGSYADSSLLKSYGFNCNYTYKDSIESILNYLNVSNINV